MNKLGLKIENYKCFKKPIGFDEIKPINIVIGKNNTGKSTLIDMIEFYYDDNKFMNECKVNNKLKLIVDKQLTENDFKQFSNSYYTGFSITKNGNKLVERASAIELFSSKMFSYNYRCIAKRSPYSDKVDIEYQKSHIISDDFKESESDVISKITQGICIEKK